MSAFLSVEPSEEITGGVCVNLAFTHNPWHPTYELSREGQWNIAKDIAPAHLDDLIKQFPNAKSWTVVINGVGMMGRVRHG